MSKNTYSTQTVDGRKERVHRLVMEAVIGRRLKPNEHVYHIDGDPKNNHPDNLIMITKKIYI